VGEDSDVEERQAAWPEAFAHALPSLARRDPSRERCAAGVVIFGLAEADREQ
jgi:hypothetical protein